MNFFNNRKGKQMNKLPFDINLVQNDIEDAMRTLPAPKPKLLEPEIFTPPLPAYVEHHIDVDQIGRLSAEAVVSQYETAAKSIEAMGVDLIDCAKRAEKMAADVKIAIAYVQDTAQKYRDEAKIIFERIEQASLLMAKVRSTCDDMRRQIDKPVDKPVIVVSNKDSNEGAPSGGQ